MVVLSNFLTPQEGIKHEEPNTSVFINEREIGKGTLYITESVLSWVNNTTQQGFSLEYEHISIHAISRDLQVHPRECLYIMVEAKVDLPGVEVVEQNEENSGDDNADSETLITEMRFTPEDPNNLDAMFLAMSHCQFLHPDPQDSSDDEIYEDAEEEEYDFDLADAYNAYTGPEEHVAGNQNGNGHEDAMDVESGMFEDAEDGI